MKPNGADTSGPSFPLRRGSPGYGRLFVVSAPSGAGKTTLCRALRERCPDLIYSVSFTTRPPRSGETNGKDYHFITPEAFRRKIREDRWAEWAQVHGNYYGTSAEFIDRMRAQGRDTLLDIDVQGALQILQRYPDSVTIFIVAPSMAVLRKRLESRGTDSSEGIDRRLKTAEEEMKQMVRYDHILVNDRLEDAVQHLVELVERTRSGGASGSRRSG